MTIANKKLHPDFTLTRERKGISAKDQATRAILANTAKYSESILKLLIDLDFDQITEDKIDEVVTIAAAQQLYLKAEYANLVVKGQFGQNTSSVFQSLQKHSSVFSGDAIEQVRRAVDLTRHMPERRDFSYRGSWNNRNNRRGFQDRDQYGSFTSSQIPRRPTRGGFGQGNYIQGTGASTQPGSANTHM